MANHYPAKRHRKYIYASFGVAAVFRTAAAVVHSVNLKAPPLANPHQHCAHGYAGVYGTLGWRAQPQWENHPQCIALLDHRGLALAKRIIAAYKEGRMMEQCMIS